MRDRVYRTVQMEWPALITWALTAGGGFVLFAIWLQRVGCGNKASLAVGSAPPLILSHFLLAATGLVLWIVYVAVDNTTLRRRQAPPAAAASSNPGEPAEQHFPVAVVALHGLLAATTLVLVFLTAVGVGGS